MKKIYLFVITGLLFVPNSFAQVAITNSTNTSLANTITAQAILPFSRGIYYEFTSKNIA